jgi:microcystin-dependent protein
MKSIVLAVLFLGSTAFACPNLSGSYTCTDEEGSSSVEIRQSVIAGATVYEISSEGETDVFVADGKTRTAVEKQDDFVLTTSQTVSCSATNVQIVIDLSVGDEAGNKIGEATAKIAASLDAKGNLLTAVESEGELETSVCVRN